MDYLILAVAVAVASYFLYNTFVKSKGCGCGKKDCHSSQKEHNHGENNQG